ncbi:MAG: hypothetical protein Fur0035_01200 [Anaerolineales bacterium]
MYKKLFVLVAMLSLLLIAASPVAPRDVPPGPSGTFGSAFTIQNMSTAVANCSYQFFNASGTAVYTSASFAIAIGGSSFTYVPNISSLASGQYSGVVSCDQQVSAVVNTGSTNSGGSYGAISAPATVWYAPNAYSNYYNYNTNFVVQNVTAAPVDVTVEIINSAGTVVATQTATAVPAYAYTNFEQAGLTGLSANVNYSAKITGTGAIAVESNIYGQGAVTNELYSYGLFTSGSTTVYVPSIMKNYYGYLTALTVQNLGASTANVTVTYGTGLVQTQAIAANSSYVFYTPNTALPSGTLTSAKITSDQNIVALVNEQNSYRRAASYGGFASGSMKVSAPIVMKRYYNYNTSVTCQNVGSAATDMTITYSNGATATISAVAANGTALFYQPNDTNLPDGFNGSATITSSSQPIVCVVNEDQNEGAQATTVFDQLFSYEGFAIP